jgi:heavy metal sensor kinase
MTSAANKIDARGLDQRLEIANREDELGRLAQTLNHMLDRLQRSFSQMQQFTADASHELRTPLTVIRTEAEVGLQKPLSEGETEELLANILEECQRLTWITDQLLTLSREDAGIIQPSRERVDLSTLVRDVAETMRPIAEGRGQQLTVSGNGAAITSGDSVRLRHVIYNLVDNAIKYTPANGRVELAIQTLPNTVQLSVEDTGVGIAPEHLPHVFERFYRVDKSRSRAEGGAGLGLSIVQSIVQAHGGQVQIESQPGSGTRCTVQLPRENQS